MDPLKKESSVPEYIYQIYIYYVSKMDPILDSKKQNFTKLDVINKNNNKRQSYVIKENAYKEGIVFIF